MSRARRRSWVTIDGAEVIAVGVDGRSVIADHLWGGNQVLYLAINRRGILTTARVYYAVDRLGPRSLLPGDRINRALGGLLGVSMLGDMLPEEQLELADFIRAQREGIDHDQDAALALRHLRTLPDRRR